MENYFMHTENEEKKYTVEDIMALPDGKRAELIDGQMFMMASPSITHQRILADLSFEVQSYIKRKGGKCEVFFAPFALFPDETGRNYFEPDMAIQCTQDIIDNKGLHGAPDVLFEIVSPSSKYMDYMWKLNIYERIGVREYWIIDPLTSHVTVYRFEKKTVDHYSFTEDIPVGIYEDLVLNLKDIEILD